MYNNHTTNKQKLKGNLTILKDVTKSGKDNKWKQRKESNLLLADSYKRLGYKKYHRVLDCSTFLEWRYFLETNEKRLNHANFCKVRLCPMCSWRRSLKIFGQVSKVMDKVEKDHDYKYIFLTLTVKNCIGDELRDTLDLMTKSFNKMNQRKAFKQAVKGYFRSLEVTYNLENDTYHPHFHLILAVNKNYFTDNRVYLSQERWTDLWKSCLQVDYSPIVDVRRFRKNTGKEVAEVAKYAVKSEDFLIRKEDGTIDEKRTDDVIETLDLALHRKRLTSFGFIFKEIHRKLNLDDTEDGDLINTDNDEELRDDLATCLLVYQWGVGIRNYKLIKVLEDNKELGK